MGQGPPAGGSCCCCCCFVRMDFWIDGLMCPDGFLVLKTVETLPPNRPLRVLFAPARCRRAGRRGPGQGGQGACELTPRLTLCLSPMLSRSPPPPPSSISLSRAHHFSRRRPGVPQKKILARFPGTDPPTRCRRAGSRCPGHGGQGASGIPPHRRPRVVRVFVETVRWRARVMFLRWMSGYRNLSTYA